MKEWELKDLLIGTYNEMEGNMNVEDAKVPVLRKSYNTCVPVYVPTIDRAELASRSHWFSQKVGE